QLITTTEYHSDDKHVYPEIISITPVKPGRYKYVVKDYFRKYNSPAECFLDHARFFEENPRYAAALKVKGDAEKFAEAIAAAGYATGPGYAELLKAVIKMVRKELKKLNQ
ncbi:MAG: peptidoglycan hydrolase, partial [Chitinophagia bacterium]|nr:peptidoglycan hydrolase [Chitinophagia bacterium]